MAPLFGLSSASVYPETVAHAFDYASRLGYDAVEVMVSIDSLSQSTEKVRALRDYHEVPVCAVHAPCLLITQTVWGTDPWVKLERSAEASWLALAARSPSALLNAITSAASKMPRFMLEISSPAPASRSNSTQSTKLATCSSDWPTPTVSTKMRSKPAASQSEIDSRVRAAIPPKTPRVGLGRTYADASAAKRDMRVLSPSTLPPV